MRKSTTRNGGGENTVMRTRSGGGAGAAVAVVAVVLLSGYFGCKQCREFFDAEVIPNLRELEVAAFEDVVAERIGH